MRRLRILLSNMFLIPYRLLCTKISCLAVLQDSIVDKQAAICEKTRFYRSNIGKHSYIGRNSLVSNTSIGNFTSIAENCFIGSANHPINWVSASPIFCDGKNILHINFSKHQYCPYKDTRIGNDVWIGEGCKIKAGVTIGDGAVVGMGSVVTKNVEPYAIYVGNPARFIRYRFDNEIIDFLVSVKWWEWEDDKIEYYAKYFQEPKELMRKYNDEK